MQKRSRDSHSNHSANMADGGHVISVDWAMVGITLLLVSLRLYTRVFKMKRWTWTDGFVILGWVFFAAQAGMDTVLWKLGFFDSEPRNPSMDVFYEPASAWEQSQKVAVLKLVYVEDIMYYFTMYCVKASMLLFYFEIINPSFRKTYWMLWITCVLTVIGFLLNCLLFSLPCQPVSTNWSLDENEICTPSDYTWALVPVLTFHLLTDFLIYSIPIPLVRALNVPMRQRIGVYFIFCVGFLDLAFAASVAAYYTSDTAGPYIISVFEQSWALIVVCLPSFKSFIQKDVKNIIGSLRSAGTQPGTVDGTRPEKTRAMSDAAKNSPPRGGAAALFDSDGMGINSQIKRKKWDQYGMTVHETGERDSCAIEVDSLENDSVEYDMEAMRESLNYKRMSDLEKAYGMVISTPKGTTITSTNEEGKDSIV